MWPRSSVTPPCLCNPTAVLSCRLDRLAVLNNTGHATEAFPADISYLKGVKYDQEEIFKAIKEGLDHAYRQGKISQDLYQASCGDT